jgi:hypothetical protein
MKDGLTLIYKIWSDLKEKECCRRVVNVEREMEKWKQNWDEVFMDEVKRERKRGEKERGGKKRGEREKNQMS